MNYYRCEKGTEAYRVLIELHRQISDCYDAAAELASELGAISFTLNSKVIGGIGSLRFIGEPNPKEYKVIGVKRSAGKKLCDCVPNIDTKEGAKIALRITKLPFIRKDDMVKRLCVTDKDYMGFSFGFYVIPVDDWFYVSSEVHLGLKGLEEIDKAGYENEEKYIRNKR